MTVDDTEDLGTILVVQIPETKTKIQQTFTITHNSQAPVNMLYKHFRTFTI